MEGEVITKAAGLLTFGTLFIWLGYDGWKHRRAERVGMIEAAVLKTGGEADPLPHDRWDRALAYIKPVLMLILGPAMIFTAMTIMFA
jgi:hypothetical protein